ncbi:hydroxypyruvate reductase [Devosia sp. Root413D1]|uniref:glycerate kinase type-2 family protein n=1 Tax=unclassified Devosia TaxID=196773 RepID=UPI000701DCB7|nr:MULTISPECIES: glycerate kinase [unclassified Devosia]KQV05875.1 hydroxypyruvate reductase [Devosia sp. Root105]KQW79292.1 hydroxypyruvate reductase [Devosia sp. Root413D1]
MDRDLLERLYHRAVDAAQPQHAIAANLPEPPRGRTVVIGAGKASAQMARAFELAWPGPIHSGLVVTRYGYATPCERIEIVEAAHPVPDMAGYLAARRLMEKVSGLGHDDLVVALISGGGSALLPQPAAGLSFEDEQAVNEILLASGAPISVMNVIRNELSAIKGGRLAALASPARVATLIVSDIPGDDPSLVASGPTVPLSSGRAEARHLASLYRLKLPAAAEELLASDLNPAPRAGDPRFHHNTVRIIASAALSLEAAAAEARSAGLEAHILSDAIEGEARDVASVHAALAREIKTRNRPFAKPALLLSGGETTVTIRGDGRGGRNAEFLLAFALAIDGIEGITALAADTDGIDGAGDNAGAICDGHTAARLRAAGIDPRRALANNDAYNAFRAVGGLLLTGPTGTNVNDFRAILVR